MKFSNFLRSLLGATALACLALVPASKPAAAAAATTTFAVNATVQATCLISATPMAFGTYTGVVANSTSTVSVTCTNTTPYNVGLDAGTATGATVTTRKMKGQTTGNNAMLSYALYSNAGRTTNWGNTVSSDTVSGTGSGANQDLTVYGQIPAGQYIAPDTYSDTITATITY